MPFDGLIRPRGNPLNQLPQGRFELDLTHPLAAAIVAYWPLNGDGRDYISGNSAAGPHRVKVGRFGPAHTFDGGSAQKLVTPGNVHVGSTWTISAWVNLTSFTASFARIAETSFSTGFYLGQGSTANRYGTFVTASGPLESSSPANFGTWEHLAVTFSGTTATLYVNAVSQGTMTATAPNADLTMKLGGDASQNSMNGSLGLVGYWLRALSASEIKRLYVEPCGILVPVRRRLVGLVVSSAINIGVAETGAAADAVTSAGKFIIQAAEAGVAVDASTDIARVAIAEAGAAADTEAAIVRAGITVAEAGTGVDAAVAVSQAAATESGTATDVVIATGFAAVAVSEAGVAADIGGAVSAVLVSETGAAVDSTTLATAVAIAIDEVVAADEAVAVSGGAPAFSVAETGTAADLVAAFGSAIAGISETTAVVESVSASRFATAAVSEIGAAADAGKVVGQIAVAETGAAIEAFVGTGSASISVTEADSVIEGFTATLPGTFAISVSEATTSADAITVGLVVAVLVSESGAATDAAAQAMSLSVSEAAIASDTVGFTAAQFIAAISESAILVDHVFFGAPPPELTNAVRSGFLPIDIRVAGISIDQKTARLAVDQRAVSVRIDQ